MPNMAAILSRQNKTVLASKNTNVHPPCNCRRKAECPLNGDCRKKSIVYKASISTDSNDPPKSYYGCCKTEFKSRFYNHGQTFKSKQKRYATELSKAFWEAIDNGRDPYVEWSISASSSTYQPGAARCNLCLYQPGSSTYQPGAARCNRSSTYQPGAARCNFVQLEKL